MELFLVMRFIGGENIISDSTDGLEWIPDLTNPNNSVLRIGPVDETDNQSSYQWTLLSGTVVSEVGTLTVLGEDTAVYMS